MTLQKLYSAIAKREAKKSQVKIGNIREVVKHLLDLAAEDIAVYDLLERNINNRIKKSS
jgi:ribosomal protein L20A (L18A)